MVYQKDSTKGFWHFDGVQWKNIYSSNNTNSVGGRNKIIIADSVTNAQAQAILAADFGPNTQEIYVYRCSLLTSLDLSMFKTSTNIIITDNPVLTTVNLSNLKSVAGHLYFNNCPLLTSINFSSLENIYFNAGSSDVAVYIGKTNLPVLNFPALKKVDGVFYIFSNQSLNAIVLPLLTEVTTLYVTWNPRIGTFSVPMLTRCDLIYMDANNYPSFSTLSFPSLTSVGRIYLRRMYITNLGFPVLAKFTLAPQYDNSATSYIYDCTLLTSITFGNIVQFSNDGFYKLNAKLSSAGVDELLHKFVSITPAITGKYFDFRMTPAAPPTGQGITDKATLIANGNTVITN